MNIFRKFIYFTLEYLGIIEIVFQIKSNNILVGVFINYIVGRHPIRLVSGQLVDRTRMEFSIQRFIEKNIDIPIYLAKLILPSQFFVNKVITVPKSAKSRIKNIITSSVEGMGMFDITSLSYNHKVIGSYKLRDKTYLKVLVSAIRLNILSEYMNYFKNIGISIIGVAPATINNIEMFHNEPSVGAVAVVINKQDEILMGIVSKNGILKLEVIEMVDRNVIENYIVSFVSDFIKERSVFLEKILMFYFDNDFVEHIFDRINILCVLGELLPKYGWMNENFSFLDILSYKSFPQSSVELSVPKEHRSVITDIIILRAIVLFTVLTLAGLIFIISTRSETERYLLIKRGIEGNEDSMIPEVKRYTEIIEMKRKINEYESFISSFYSRFAQKQKYFYVLYDVFSSLDRDTWLKDVEVFQKTLRIRGFSINDTSFYITISNLSKISRFSKVKVISVRETQDNLLRFEVEISI
ncbi:MAG: hypothetical protein N3D81_03135 [Spirochaetes bacterium]|nr:hypothetical protein [Spirochaetota bacterium]